MKTELLQGLDERQKEERKAILYGSAAGLKVIEDVLVARLEVLNKKILSSQAYASPSWAYMQADMIGEARAYQAVLDLLILDRES